MPPAHRPLEALQRERAALFPWRAAVPILWHLLEAEISIAAAAPAPAAAAAAAAAAPVATPTTSTATTSTTPARDGEMERAAAAAPAAAPQNTRRLPPSFFSSSSSSSAPSSPSSASTPSDTFPPDWGLHAAASGTPCARTARGDVLVRASGGGGGGSVVVGDEPHGTPATASASSSLSSSSASSASSSSASSSSSPKRADAASGPGAAAGASVVVGPQTPVPALSPPSTHPPHHAPGRKRAKLPVPADKYPEYNFVGRLLGPRGTTLKTLERDTGCKIMIRGKGSIRKDKEADVRGKPGWEHVFLEPLHVVIEVGDAVDDADAPCALIRAREAVELLLVPVPEERDGLKRQQLRDLAILNGTFRGVPATNPPAQQQQQQQAPGSAHPTHHEYTHALANTHPHHHHPHPHHVQVHAMHSPFPYGSNTQSASALGGYPPSPRYSSSAAGATVPHGHFDRFCHPHARATPDCNTYYYSTSNQLPHISQPVQESQSEHTNRFGVASHQFDPSGYTGPTHSHGHVRQLVQPGRIGQPPPNSEALSSPCLESEVFHQQRVQQLLHARNGTPVATTLNTHSTTSSTSTVTSTSPPRPTWGNSSLGLFSLDALGTESLSEAMGCGTFYSGPSSAPPPRSNSLFARAPPPASQELLSNVGGSESHPSASSSPSVNDDDIQSLAVDSCSPVVAPTTSRYGGVFMGSEFYSGAFTNFPTTPGYGHLSHGIGIDTSRVDSGAGGAVASPASTAGILGNGPLSPWSKSPSILPFEPTIPAPRH